MSVSVEKLEERYFIRAQFYVFNDLTTRESIAFMLNARIYWSNIRKTSVLCKAEARLPSQ
jgi:hypothetical protein